jgi:hypothetical protein
MSKRKVKTEYLFFSGMFLFFVLFFSASYVADFRYKSDSSIFTDQKSDESNKKEIASHISTPSQVRALYMSSWVASVPSMRDSIVEIFDANLANAVVIDVKDYSGKINFQIDNPELKKYGSEEVRAKDLVDFLNLLHKKGVYTIARIAVFQDAYFVNARPDLAVKSLDGKTVWKDRKGISWIDPGSREYWDYIVLLAKEAHLLGFDELNFDYIRYPSDGNMTNISYPWTGSDSKPETLKSFFSYLSDNLKNSGAKISADIFGMTTTATDDMGIGQVFENTLLYFDYVAPMVYPSHYPSGFQNFKNPAEHPYDVIHLAMDSAIKRTKTASSTIDKLRPWIQDFNLGANYGVPEIKAQIKALNDLGLHSFMVWSPSNKYTKGGLELSE